MARITGLARSTIYHGLSDVRDNVAAAPGRIRKLGGGRKKKIFEDPNLLSDLKALVEPTTRGDPMRPIFWTCRSLRNLVKELGKKGHKVCPTVVGNLLRGMDYSLQANSKTREGSRHIDRDAQFRYINDQAVDFLGADQPVISVDTKRKELVENFKNNGREWSPKGTPELVNVHDFIDPKLRRAVPYGVYDINANVGWVSVGTDHDTASFAVNAISRWWSTMGRKRHANAKRLMITADGGGSNGYRVRLWKVELQNWQTRSKSRLLFAISRREQANGTKLSTDSFRSSRSIGEESRYAPTERLCSSLPPRPPKQVSRCAPSWTRRSTPRASRSPMPSSLRSTSSATHSTAIGTTRLHRGGAPIDLFIYGQALRAAPRRPC